MKCQALFPLKNKNKFRMLFATILPGALRVNNARTQVYHNYDTVFWLHVFFSENRA